MDEDQTASVSKGVFVFNKIRPCPKKSKTKKPIEEPVTNSVFSNHLWYSSFSNLWSQLEGDIEDLNNDMFSSVLVNIIDFIKTSYDNKVNEIPTAALLTGINMPDHAIQFQALTKQIKQKISPHVACLHSEDCQNFKYLVESMISQFINQEVDSEDMETEEIKPIIKKNQLNLSLLQCWYENLYSDTVLKSPRKKMKLKRNPLVVIISDFESFDSKILQKWILIASFYINVLPFVFVFGIATYLTTLHTSLPYKVLSKISVQVFNSESSTMYLNNVLENVFFTLDCPFQLGGKVFNLFTDIFLFYDLSVNNFIQNIKYAMVEHFCYGNAMSLCTSARTEAKKILDNFTHEDCENVRHLMSFRKLVESESYRNRVKLLTDDDYLKMVLDEKTNVIRKYIRRLHIFLKCLHILVEDLPKSPLGKQLRELYAMAVSKNITTTQEYKECFQLLGFQSKDELCIKLSKICDYVATFVNANFKKQNKFQEFVEELKFCLNNLNNFDGQDDIEEVTENGKEENVVLDQMDRKQFKEKLLGMSKQQMKPMNRYEKIRMEVLQFLSKTFETYLPEPSSFYFHEIFFFNDISIQNDIIGVHRSAIHNALNDPQYYLQCACCEIPNDTVIKPSMPDICVVYKLHLECGKMINLYDWLQAFLSIVDTAEVETESKRIVDPKLQARFTQAVAELEYLGFVKSSKRKADHVTRLTWGG